MDIYLLHILFTDGGGKLLLTEVLGTQCRMMEFYSSSLSFVNASE